MYKLNSYHIHALHGFMGQPHDWSRFSFAQSSQFSSYQLLDDFPILPFTDWTEIFNQKIMENFSFKNNIFLGYSLGARLGLHALINKPKLWKAAIFLSTHPGLKTVEERKIRTSADYLWAKRFEKDSWDDLMKEWNAQNVFKHDTPIERKETDHDRKSLSKALRTWSLGTQEDLRLKIASLEIPILWIVGEKDRKFLSLGCELTFKHSHSKLCVVSESGHRLQSGELEDFILNFIKKL